MEITSPAFADNGYIPSQYTCEGIDINPPLDIANPPSDTKSFALIVHDPDAPNGDFVHWLLWNIPATTQHIEEHSTPQGAQEGITDFHRSGWGGPCPPLGTHRYQFHLYALASELTLPANADKVLLRKNMHHKIIAETSLIGIYQKQELR